MRKIRAKIEGIFVGSIILILLFCGCNRSSDPATSRAEPPPILVAVDRVEEGPAVVEQSFVGTVIPLRRTVVASPVEGQVVEFLARKGSFVKAGRNSLDGGHGVVPLARLRTNEVVTEIAGAVAELEVREHELDELKLSAPRETEQAKARMEAAETGMKLAQWRLKRAQDLHRERIASDEELEQLRSAADEAVKLYEERKAACELVDAKFWSEKLAQAKAKVDVQKHKIERLREDLRQREIFAPFDGYVTEEYVEVGEWLPPGGQIAELVEIDEVYIEVPVFESCISQLRTGTRARVEIEALAGSSFTGEVAAIVPKADLQSRSFPVRIRLKNPVKASAGAEQAPVRDLLFKPGMFARVHLPVKNTTMLSVPKDSLVLGEASPFVWMIEASSTNPPAGEVRPKRVSIQVALQGPDDQRAEVVGPRDETGLLPLKAGQWVIVEGNERITSEHPVKIIKPVLRSSAALERDAVFGPALEKE